MLPPCHTVVTNEKVEWPLCYVPFVLHETGGSIKSTVVGTKTEYVRVLLTDAHHHRIRPASPIFGSRHIDRAPFDFLHREECVQPIFGRYKAGSMSTTAVHETIGGLKIFGILPTSPITKMRNSTYDRSGAKYNGNAITSRVTVSSSIQDPRRYKIPVDTRANRYPSTNKYLGKHCTNHHARQADAKSPSPIRTTSTACRKRLDQLRLPSRPSL